MAVPYECPPMMMGAHLGFGFFWQLLIFVAFFLVVWWLIRQSPREKDSASGILKKRLARGEITEAEYKKLKKEIEE